MKPPQNPSDVFPGFFRRIRLSVIPGPVIPRTEQDRKRYLLKNLILHFRPSMTPEKTLRFTFTWGLGGTAALLALLQFGTGVLLKFVYEPTPVGAYASVQALISEAPFGRLVRNLHHWSANLLVLAAFLHMLRVFFTGAFHPPRQFNWVIGLSLLITVLLANFTGYLLPWDQLAFWAVTVSTAMLDYIPWIGPFLQKMIRGGTDIGPGTLRIFFAIHTAVVPILMLFLMAFHFWRIRKAGGLVIPGSAGEAADAHPVRLPALPNLFVRELAMAAGVVAALLWLSVFADAPLSAPANPGLSPNPIKAPWYFAGLQELLLHLHPTVAVCILPLVFGVAVLAAPYLKYESDTAGVWFASPAGLRISLIAALSALILTVFLILLDESVLRAGNGFSGIPPFIGRGVIPVIVLVAIILAFCRFLKQRFCASKNEIVQAVFVFLTAAFGVLTATGVWFRGQGMILCVPW